MSQSARGAAVRQTQDEAVFSAMDAAAEQRRAHSRYAVELDIGINSDHNFYAGLVENMSAGGVFIATHLRKPIGERLELTIHLPGAEAPVRASGEVRWVREYSADSNVPPGIGVCFIDLDQRSLELVTQFLSCREPLLYD
jgi:uncharacterized protein (TIGR02266 family)